jgi:hypothetical protein
MMTTLQCLHTGGYVKARNFASRAGLNFNFSLRVVAAFLRHHFESIRMHIYRSPIDAGIQSQCRIRDVYILRTCTRISLQTWSAESVLMMHRVIFCESRNRQLCHDGWESLWLHGEQFLLSLRQHYSEIKHSHLLQVIRLSHGWQVYI